MKDFLWNVFGQPILKTILVSIGGALMRKGWVDQSGWTAISGGAMALGVLIVHAWQAWQRHGNGVSTSGSPLKTASSYSAASSLLLVLAIGLPAWMFVGCEPVYADQTNAAPVIAITTGDAVTFLLTNAVSWLYLHGSAGGGYFCVPEISRGKLKLNGAGEGATESACPAWARFQVAGTFSNEFGAATAQVATDNGTKTPILGTWQIEIIPTGSKPATGAGFWYAIRQKLAGAKVAMYAGTDIDKMNLRVGIAGSLPIGD